MRLCSKKCFVIYVYKHIQLNANKNLLKTNHCSECKLKHNEKIVINECDNFVRILWLILDNHERLRMKYSKSLLSDYLPAKLYYNCLNQLNVEPTDELRDKAVPTVTNGTYY